MKEINQLLIGIFLDLCGYLLTISLLLELGMSHKAGTYLSILIWIPIYLIFQHFVLLRSKKEISDNLENSNDIFLQGEQKSMSEKRTKSDKTFEGGI